MNLNVLVVDDSAVMRKFVVKSLALCGFSIGTIHQAANGAEALALLETEWIDLALVDVNMPVVNGEEFLCRVRADPVHRDLPIVIVSTEGSETRIERLTGRNAGFVRKPFTPAAMRAAIAEQIGEPHASATGSEAVPSSGPDF